jgi:hypothetical protein
MNQSVQRSSHHTGSRIAQAFHEHEEHRRFFSEHMVKKGCEAARACRQVLTMRQPLAA